MKSVDGFGNVKDSFGRIVGRIDNGRILDSNGLSVGHLNEFGTVIGNDGMPIGGLDKFGNLSESWRDSIKLK